MLKLFLVCCTYTNTAHTQKNPNCFYIYVSYHLSCYNLRLRSSRREREIRHRNSQAMLNQSLFEDDQDMASQLGLFSFSSNNNNIVNTTLLPIFGCTQMHSLKTLTSIPCAASLAAATASDEPLTESSAAHHQSQKEDLSSFFGGPQLLHSLQRSTSNLWAWGVNEWMVSSKRSGSRDEHLGVSAMKMKKIKARRKVREPRFSFKTMSDVDVLDDGYKWRKYGQKVVKNTQHSRSYYRCTQDNCRVKKRVERLAEDPRMVITTYEGRHVHSPSHDNDQDSSQASSQLINNNLLW